MWFEEYGSALSGSDNSPQPSCEIPSSAVLFLINFLCRFSTVLILWQRERPLPVKHWPERWCYPYLTVKCVRVFEALLDVWSICGFVSWSTRETDSLVLEDVWLQSNKSEWRLAFDLQQAGLSQCPPAKKRAENWAGDLWAPLAPASRWAEGRNRWAIWWLAGTRQGLFCSRVCMCVCVCSTNRLGHVVLGDHLSCGCSSSLSCVVSSAALAQPDTELCWDISLPLFNSLSAFLCISKVYQLFWWLI